MKIPHPIREYGFPEAAVEYSKAFPDWEVDLERLPKLIFGLEPIGVWLYVPEAIFKKALSEHHILSTDDVVEAAFFVDGKWCVRGVEFETKEDMMRKVDWVSLVHFN